MICRLNRLPPLEDAASARSALDKIMRNVEDELSGIAENPNAATSPPDGRMYPPDDRFEKISGSSRVRLFKQTGHETWFWGERRNKDSKGRWCRRNRQAGRKF
jgi:hypothetical protein